jgi:hypothetical protein
MRFRTTIVLILLLLGLGAYVYFVEYPKAEQEAKKKTLFEFKADDATQVSLVYDDREIVLKKSGDEWRLIKPIEVAADATGKKGLQATELVKTSANSWGETDLDALFQNSQASFDSAVDTKGPVPIAVVVNADLKQMGTEKDGTARLAVYGSVEFADNHEVDGTYYNRDLFLNTVDWLAGQADLLSIRPRNVRASRVQFTAEQGTVIFYLSVLVIPELLLIAGIAVWWRRE